VRRLVEHPAVRVSAGRVSVSDRSPYAVEVSVKSDGRYLPRPAEEEKGTAFVPLGPREVFAVNLVNGSDHDAAVELMLDGLSVFAFSDSPAYRHLVVPRRGSTLVRGWHRTNRLSEAFVITDYPRSAVAELLANPDRVGTITATFAAAWDP